MPSESERPPPARFLSLNLASLSRERNKAGWDIEQKYSS